MVQKKLSQKKSQKEKKENLKDEKLQNEVNLKRKDENNNRVQIVNEFCKGNHFVCLKFTNDEYNYVLDTLKKFKEDKELSDELDLEYLDELLDDHHLICRYMMRNRRDQEKQIDFILKVLKWRKASFIYKIKRNLFPREAMELGMIFI